MSRTYKDQPSRVTHPENEWRFGVERVDYTFKDSEGYEVTWFRYLDLPGVHTKKKRSYRERHWMTTPMWWVRLMMNQPQRVATKQWEKKVVKVRVEDIIDLDTPSVSRRPHWYYW
jgi:TATA-binding protein-associated factor Taf7